MKEIIRYFYKGAIVSENPVPGRVIREGWVNDNPPYRPENWDKWEIATVALPYSLYSPDGVQRELVL